MKFRQIRQLVFIECFLQGTSFFIFGVECITQVDVERFSFNMKVGFMLYFYAAMSVLGYINMGPTCVCGFQPHFFGNIRGSSMGTSMGVFR